MVFPLPAYVALTADVEIGIKFALTFSLLTATCLLATPAMAACDHRPAAIDMPAQRLDQAEQGMVTREQKGDAVRKLDAVRAAVGPITDAVGRAAFRREAG